MRGSRSDAYSNFINLDKLTMWVIAFVAIVYVLIVIVPLYYIFISSFKGNVEIFTDPLGYPKNWTFDNFFIAQERVNIFRTMGVSSVITISTEILTLFVGFLAAYAIARIPTRLARLTETYFGSGFLIPAFAVLVPVYLMAAKTGLLYNPIFLIVFYTASHLPLTIIILASHMRQIPREMEESARIDGASQLQIIRHIFFPLTQAGVITVLVLNFIGVWNEYIFALILLGTDYRTVQVAIPLLRSERVVDYGLIAAGITLSMVPIYMVFAFFQERIVLGMSKGAVKT